MRRDSRYRFLINVDEDNLEVHDLDNEKNGCQIDEIKEYKYLISTTIQGLEVWLRKNPEYDGGEYCLPEYHRK